MKSVKKIVLATAAISVCFSFGAFAYNPAGAYAGIGGGFVFVKYPSEKTMTNALGSFSKQDYSSGNVFGQLFAGYLYPVAAQFAVGPQLGYNYYGRIFNFNGSGGGAHATLSSRSQSIDLKAVAKYAFQKWFVTANVGLGYFMNETKGNIVTPEVNGAGVKHYNKVNPVAGLGLGYAINQNFNIAANYEHVFGKNQTNKITKNTVTMDTLSLSIAYQF